MSTFKFDMQTIKNELEISTVLFEIFLEKNVGKKDQNMTNPSYLKLVVWPFTPERNFL